MKKKLVYNGKSSVDMGLIIQSPPAYQMPSRDVETTHVPGRNGDIISDNGCYKNVDREYSLAKEYAYGPNTKTVDNGQKLYEWLTSAKGKYIRLEDDYDPDVYRLATYIDNGTITNIFDKAYTFTAKFNCKPQRFLKIGEQPIEYTKGLSTVTINNQTVFDAKPIIKIENIPGGSNANTMLSVKDSDGIEVSLATLKGSESEYSTLNINSETEECYDENLNNASDRISLNGMNFPILKNNKTTISISQYDRENYNIPSYNTLIQSKQTVCESTFSDRDTTISSFEEKYIIRPFNTLVNERKNLFEASSYQTRLTELCDEGINFILRTDNGEESKIAAIYHTIASPNQYNSGVNIEISPEQTYESFCEEFKSYGLNNYFECSCGDTIPDSNDGKHYFKIKKNTNTNIPQFVKQNDNKLKAYMNDNPIIVDSSEITKTTMYELVGGLLETIQEDLPGFIKLYYAIYDGYLYTLIYKFNIDDYYKSTTKKQCIYWKDKVGLTGLLGKAGWSSVVNGNNIITYIWSSLKKQFVPNGNLLTSDNGYSIRFVCFCDESKDKLQYDFGENSAKIFTVDSIENDLSIKINTVNSGYYKLDLISNNWSKINKNTYIGKDIESKKSFKIEYLKEIPKYSNESDWPNWLNSNPEYYPSEGLILNATYLNFKVNPSKSYYRTYIKNSEDVEKAGLFYQLSNSDSLKDFEGTNILNIDLDDTTTVSRYNSKMWPNPDDVPNFPYDRPNSINNGTPLMSPDKSRIPEWIRYDVEMKVKFNIDPNNEYISDRKDFTQYVDTSSNDMICSYEWTCIKIENQQENNTNDNDIAIGTVLYTNKNKPVKNDKIYIISNSTFIEKFTIDESSLPIDSDDGGYEITITDTSDITYTLVNNIFKWKTNTSNLVDIPKYFYTKKYWYANVSDKIFDIDGNEIGSVSVEPTIYFYSGILKGGFYKYDNASAWVYYDKNNTTQPIVKISYKDSIVFYYIETLPDTYEDYYTSNIWIINDNNQQFKTNKTGSDLVENDKIFDIDSGDEIGYVKSYDISSKILTVYINETGEEKKASLESSSTTPEWVNYLSISRKPAGNLNPLTIQFKIKDLNSSGYYKSNSLVHWKYYSNDDIILESLVNETNTISHLKPNTDDTLLNNIQITIIPNWWML